MMWFCLVLGLGLASSQTINETEPVENILGNPCTDKNHLFLAPGVLTAGSVNRACVSRFYTDGPARLVLTLLTEDRQTVSASSQLSGDGGCLDINVPSLPNTKADLIVNIRYPEAQCVWERRLPLRISSGRVVVLSTERARYRPGELLRLRVLALRQDLAPSHGLIEEVWLEGPRGAWEGSRVTQWQHVRTRLGIAQLQYQLDELAPSGKWTVRARLNDGSQGSSVFWVGNYELPPFQLSVRHAPRVLRTSDRLVWHVCVRYPWSEAVEGMLVIRLRGAGGGRGAGVRTAVRLRAPRACHRHAVAAKRIGLDGTDPPDVVVADFSFQEDGTRIWQNTTVVSQVVDKPISLEFLTKYRAVISPGLPYKLKVKATRWDDKPAPNELVRVCRYPATLVAATSTTAKPLDSMCAEGATDAGGVAILLFAAGDDAAPFYRFEAHLSNDTSTSAVPLSLPVRRPSALFAALGPLKPDPGQARTFVPLYLNTNNTSKPYTVHFVVITRGGVIIRWAATTQCLTSTSGPHAHTAPRNSKCDTNNEQRDVIMTQRKYKSNRIIRRIPFGDFPGAEVLESTGSHDVLMAQRDTSSANVTADVSDALLNRHQLRVMLPIKVSHQMCPDSHLIAYFYHEGELISASKHFDMDECFVNKVEATWLTRQAQPGSTVSLQVSTPGPALCDLTVLDTAAKWIQPPQSPKEQLMASLRRLIDSHRNLTEYDLAGVCFLNSDNQDIPSTSIELTASWMAAAGVRLLGGDLQAGSRNCIARPPALLVAEEATVPRSDFSEAFLWRLLSISANGTGVAVAHAPDSITRYEASALCVSRSGVAVSAPAVLQVFREFFIHADSPKRLRRGDSTIVRYRIFNYLYEPLSVQIQILTDPHVEGPKDLVESACVRARASIARRVEIRARVAGAAKIRIRAKAVSDGNCGNVTSGRTGVSDEVVIRIAVESEGVPIREQKSIFLCGNSSSESSKSEVLWNWPAVPAAVPGTETLTVWAVGDVTGPLLADADSLLTIPRGCGEQNMAQLATNLLALNQLEPSSIAALTAKEHVARGFTRQLQYVHPSGGFSAFGPSDSTSSTWLTAFVVKHMRRAHKVLWPNLQVPPAIIRAERWLLNQQMENGCFRNEGQVFHRELRGGLNDEGEIASVALTAYVITALIESSSPLPYRVIRNTLSCLRAFPLKKSKTPTRVYAQALLAYAYMKLQDYEEELRSTNEASLRRSVGGLEENEGVRQVLELLKVARRSGEYVWWEANSLSTSIEATSYALLALHSAPRSLSPSARTDAPAAARWLNAHRTTSGGFVSTQDTLVALEALTAWSSQGPDTNLTVTARCGGTEQRISLQPGVRVPDIVNMKPGEHLSVSVEGAGCALVQATRSYNMQSPDATPRDKQLSVQVSVHTDGPFDCDADGANCLCAAVVEVPSDVFHLLCSTSHALLQHAVPGRHSSRQAAVCPVQATRSYNMQSPDATPRDKQLSVQVSVHTDGPFDCDADGANCLCAAVVEVPSDVFHLLCSTSHALLQHAVPGRHSSRQAAVCPVQATRSYNMQSPDATPRDKQLSVQVSVHTDGPFDCDADGANCLCAAVVEVPSDVFHLLCSTSHALLQHAVPGRHSSRQAAVCPVQATRSYNMQSPDATPRDKQLSVQVSVHTDGPFDCDADGANCLCAAVVEVPSDVFHLLCSTSHALLQHAVPGRHSSRQAAVCPVQATRSYNMQSPDATPRDKQLSVQVSVHTDGPFDCDADGANCLCAAVVEACVMWTGSFPEMALLEVTLPGGFGADAQRLYSQLQKTTTLLRRIELTPQNTRTTFYLGSRDGSDTSGHIGHQCYNIHATGPRVKTRPAYAKVQDYYAPSINDTQVYTIPEECPPRILHETNDYLPTDNLYAKARAVDSDDIVITHDFSFDDIPEGIPLDDPLMFDHILNENDNYRIAAERHQEIGRLKESRHTKYFAEDVPQQNISDSVLQQHILSLKSAELNQRHFDNIVAGYFRTNDRENPSASKSKEKNINHSNVVGGYFGIPKITGTELGSSSNAVIEKDHTNENVADHDLEATVVQNMRLNDSNEKHQSTIGFGADESYFGMIDEVAIDRKHFSNRVSGNNKAKGDVHEVQSDFALRVGGNNTSKINDRVVLNHRKVNTVLKTKNNADSVKNDTNQNNNKKLNSVHDNSNAHNIATSNTNSDKDTAIEDHNYFYNVANKNAMTIVETDIEQNSYNIDSEYQKSELKTESSKVNDESKDDNENNLVKEIDSLNKVANQQLNATKSRFNVNKSKYKLFDTFVEDDNIMNTQNNQNSDNSFDNYNNNEGPKSREKDIKRSYKEDVTDVIIKPEVSEKLVTDYGTDLETENDKGVENPNLADFHVIDTEKDLEVPAGIEGPIPASVLPPPGFVPPAPEHVDARRLEHEEIPTRTFPHQALPPPPKFILPPKSNSPMKTLPAEMSFGDERPVMFDGLPPSVNYPAPHFHGYRVPQDSYTGFSRPSIERAFGTILPPRSSDTVSDLRRLHSIDTPNGQYFYFQADNGYAANRRYFIPSQ
ncbi:hypothetical protein PYW07_005536 [Mythimna separata]|uniref:Uncharacterized protein n=1 Tax=Mythimna separata TaxID=271217 RepID=A0AAD7YJ00_MYTSE|nr:hypothetical protein PYW07_005536 [Mythimna separata]